MLATLFLLLGGMSSHRYKAVHFACVIAAGAIFARWLQFNSAPALPTDIAVAAYYASAGWRLDAS